MTKQDVKEIVLAKYPEIGDDKYVPKLPDISEDALIELETIISAQSSMSPKSQNRINEILSFIDNIKDKRAKR